MNEIYAVVRFELVRTRRGQARIDAEITEAKGVTDKLFMKEIRDTEEGIIETYRVRKCVEGVYESEVENVDERYGSCISDKAVWFFDSLEEAEKHKKKVIDELKENLKKYKEHQFKAYEEVVKIE